MRAMPKGWMQLAPEIMHMAPAAVPCRIVGSGFCDHAVLLMIEGNALEEGATYVAELTRDGLKQTVELVKVRGGPPPNGD
jgi:hypothetical protein